MLRRAKRIEQATDLIHILLASVSLIIIQDGGIIPILLGGDDRF